ncbi:MAG: hypothetical protein ABEJ27_05210 [Halodesulfurarchaeum sp.]
MTETETPTIERAEQLPEETPWQQIAQTDPIRVRDPLAEVLGMVPEGHPLVVTFEEVAKAAGHACPAVAGAYRSTQLGLDRLYPDAYPIRSEIAVTVGGNRGDPGLGPMANVIRQITGAADETGFAGFGGYGGRKGLLSFGEVEGQGRSFRFERSDTGSSVVVSFDPSKTGVDPDSGGGSPMQTVSKIIGGEADDEEVDRFRSQWHDRVQRILDSLVDGGPFTVRKPE